MNNISTIGKSCCGCRACEQACPKDAIKFKADFEGFLQPEIDLNKCLNCGLCEKVCPVHNVNVNTSKQIGYAAKTKDTDDLKNCSSGGLFFVLAKCILKAGGVVCGCSVDQQLMPYHVIVSSIDEVKQMRGSKYVQSNIGLIYSSIKQYLDEGTKVLFTGVPCQVAGLRNYLRKPYDNLYCIDIICHGVPSRKMYSSYLDWLSKKYGEICSVDFRSKKRHDWSLTLRIVSKQQCGKMQEHITMASLDPYYYNFLQGNTYRESCYQCRYSQQFRSGNITLGDFWGIEKTHPELFDIRGLSCVIVNDDKGNDLFQIACSELHVVEVPLEDIVNYNGNLRTPTKRNSIRDTIYNRLDTEGFDSVPYNISIKAKIVDEIKNIIPNRWRYKIKSLIRK